MKTIYVAETLSDLKALQQSERPIGDRTPYIGEIVIDMSRLKVELDNPEVSHNFTPASLIKVLGEAAGLEIKVT